MVATRAGGLPEMVLDGETGLLSPIGDPGELARRLVRLISDAPLAAKVAEGGRRLVEAEYTVGRMVEKTIDAYASLPTAR